MLDLAFKLPAEGSPVSGSTRVLNVDLTNHRADDVVDALRQLISREPSHPGILPLMDVGLADNRPFIVTAPTTGESLDAALELYGPAAVDDALPRVRLIAEALDRAALSGLCHGALTPGDIVVSADETRLAGIGVAGVLARFELQLPPAGRFTAPEIAAGAPPSNAADQYSLAVIAYDWMFGPAVAPVDGFVAVPQVPGINAAAMQRVFDVATAADPAARFPSCLAFADALARSVMEVPVGDLALVTAAELPLHAGDGVDAIADAPMALPRAAADPSRFGIATLLAMLVVGAAAGAGGTWLLLKPQPATEPLHGGLHELIDAPVTAGPPSPVAAAGPTTVEERPVNPPRDDVAPAAQADAGVLVHSTPAGAMVTVDGIPRGTTPVAVRGLAPGARTVVVSRPGYAPAERQVTLTAERPSRTLEIELTPLRTAPAPSETASGGGSLVIDSRPSGAAVTIDGRRAGTTPLTMTGLAPGTRTVRLERPGYRPVTTTVTVKAGERARVAARLEGGPYEE